ncbi:MAG: outer membrane beta-barrel domain-containing protein [Deltaproteobacteria bacterium]|nr:outer membrane beta-barrel domain-containing protein [Deltaproteobacteria bacterium]
MNKHLITTLSVGLALQFAVSATPAFADDNAEPPAAAPARKPNKLDGQPAVRNRLLLVKGRAELTPLFESTINADFRHIVGGGAKLEYHFSDMFSVGVVGVFSTSIDTGLVKKIVPTLPMDHDPTKPREPTRTEFTQHLNSMPIHGAAYVSLTPWYGKLAAFSKAFVNFDFYFQAGVSFAQLKSSCDASICSDQHPGETTTNAAGDPVPPDDNPNNDAPLNNGARVGLYLAGGIHVFLKDFIALDLGVRDYAFSDNPSGADFNADLAVKKEDSRFLSHLFVGFGVSIMLPAKAKRTR